MLAQDTFEDYKELHLEKKRDGTAQTRESHARQFLMWAERDGVESLSDVRQRTIERHLTGMMGDYADRTVRTRYDSLLSFFRWATEADDVEVSDDPTKDVNLQEYDLSKLSRKAQAMGEEVIFLSRDEIEKLVDPNNMPNPTKRNELLIRLLYQTGIRAGELQSIRLSDVDREERSIKIRGEKTDSIRTVYYQPSLDSLLNLWLDQGLRAANEKADDSPYLFLTYKKKKLRLSTVRDVVKDAAHNAGIQTRMYEDAAGRTHWKVTPHTLRHTYAVHAVRGGMDIQRLALLMGHTDSDGRPNIDTTRIYLQFKDDALKEAARKFGPSVS